MTPPPFHPRPATHTPPSHWIPISLSCFVSFYSVARFQPRPPCEHKTGLERAEPRCFQPASPKLLDLRRGIFFFVFLFIFFLALDNHCCCCWRRAGNDDLSARTSTSCSMRASRLELWSSPGWGHPIMLFAFSVSSSSLSNFLVTL